MCCTQSSNTDLFMQFIDLRSSDTYRIVQWKVLFIKIYSFAPMGSSEVTHKLGRESLLPQKNRQFGGGSTFGLWVIRAIRAVERKDSGKREWFSAWPANLHQPIPHHQSPMWVEILVTIAGGRQDTVMVDNGRLLSVPFLIAASDFHFTSLPKNCAAWSQQFWCMAIGHP